MCNMQYQIQFICDMFQLQLVSLYYQDTLNKKQLPPPSWTIFYVSFEDKNYFLIVLIEVAEKNLLFVKF